MKSLLKLIFVFLLLLTSCNKIANKTKDTINKSGEALGETTTEFFEGVTEGVEKTLECEILLSQELIDKGVKTGSYAIKDIELGGKNNLLTLYIIFDKAFKADVIAKAFDKNNLEIGRSKICIESSAGEAKYFDFEFDKRTYIGVRNKIMIE